MFKSIVGTILYLIGVISFYLLTQNIWIIILILPLAVWWTTIIPKFKNIRRENIDADKLLKNKKEKPTLPKEPNSPRYDEFEESDKK